MSISSRKYLTAIVLLSITLTLLIYINIGNKKDISSNSVIKLSDFPLEIGQWRGSDITLSERTYEILETKNVLVREYTNPEGESIALAIVHSAHDRATFHPPEICYVGAGVELLDKTVESINLNNSLSIKANKLVMKDKGGLQLAWYWFTASSNTTHNYYLQQLYIVWNGLLRHNQSGKLIRVSTRVSGNDILEADTRVKDFIIKNSRYF